MAVVFYLLTCHHPHTSCGKFEGMKEIKIIKLHSRLFCSWSDAVGKKILNAFLNSLGHKRMEKPKATIKQ